MCSGVVPQQPPTKRAPASTRRLAYSPVYSGDAMYILRSPTSRGSPAFGCAESGQEVTRAIRSIASSTPCGPTEQLSPTTSAPKPSSARATVSGSVPYAVFPSSWIVIWANTGRSHTARTARSAS